MKFVYLATALFFTSCVMDQTESKTDEFEHMIGSDEMDSNETSEVLNFDDMGGSDTLYYFDVDCILREKYVYGDVVPRYLMSITLVDDSTLCRELRSYNGSFNLSENTFYGYQVGDTMHFDKIRRDLFFKLRGHEGE